MAYGLPSRGQQDWDDELNNSIESLRGTVENTAAKADVADSNATYARNKVDGYVAPTAEAVNYALQNETAVQASVDARIDAKVAPVSTVANAAQPAATLESSVAAKIGTAGALDSALSASYAAKLDATGLSTAAIQAWLDAPAVLGIKILVGTINLTTALNVPAGVTLDCQDYPISLPHGTVSGAVVLNTRSRLRRARIVGTGAKASDAHAVSIGAVTDAVVEDCCFTDWHGNAIKSTDSARLRVRNNYIKTVTRSSGDNGCGILLRAVTADNQDALIEGNWVETVGGTAIGGSGDFNRSDWATAGVKIRNARVLNNYCSGASFAGFSFIGIRDSLLANNVAVDNTDYGVGVEYAVNCTLSGNAAHRNTTFGVSLYSNSTGCTVSGNTCSGNGYDGIGVSYQAAVSGDSPAGGNAVTGNTCTGNAQNGIGVGSMNNVTVSGNTCTDNTLAGIELRGNGGLPADGSSVKGNLCASNGTHGIAMNGPNVTGSHISENVCTGNSGWGIYNALTMVDAGITNNRLLDNAQGGIRAVQATDTEVEGNTIRTLGATIGIDVRNDGGFSPQRLIVRNNNVRGDGDAGSYGVVVSAGANSGAGNGVTVADNDVANVGSPYLFLNMGADAPLMFSGRIAGTPAGVIAAAPGSTAYRIDGGAATSLYVKESDFNGTSGWVAK